MKHPFKSEEQDQLIRDNEILAEFLGAIRDPSGDVGSLRHYDGVGLLGGYSNNFIYHLSWDWMVKVTKKLSDMDSIQWCNKDSFEDDQVESIKRAMFYGDIKCAFEDVVELVKRIQK